jgi:hypothetical protein
LSSGSELAHGRRLMMSVSTVLDCPQEHL